jgi:hypothetical protein
MTQHNSEHDVADHDRMSGPLASAVRGICNSPAPSDVEARVLAAAAGWKAPVVREKARRAGPVAVATAVCAVLAAGVLLVVTQLPTPPRATDQTVVQSFPKPRMNDFAVQFPPAIAPDGATPVDPRIEPTPDPSNTDPNPGATAPGLGMQPPIVALGATPGANDGIERASGGFGFGANSGRGLGGIAMGATVNPAPLNAIAADAPVIVTLGGAQPIRLGGQWKDDGTRLLHVWDWRRSEMSRPLGAEQHGNPAAVSPDGKWITTFEGRKIDVATGAVEQIEPPFGDGVQKVRFSPDGRTLLLWVIRGHYQGSVRLLDFPTCAPRVEIPEVFGYMFAVAFTADGNELVLMDREMFIRRWDALTGVELQKFATPHTNSIRALAVSPDGRWVASAGPEGELFLHDAHTGALRHRLNAEPKIGPEMVYSLQFSPDGRQLAGGGIDDLFLWDCESGEQKWKAPHGLSAAHIRFSEDGRWMTTVTGTYGHRDEQGQDTLGYPIVRHWNAETGDEVAAAAVEDGISLDRLITGFDELAVIDPSVHVLVGVSSTQTLLEKVIGAVRTLPAGEVSAGVFASGNPEAGVFIVFDDTDAGRQAKERVAQALNAADIAIKDQFAKGTRSRMYYGAVPADYAITPEPGSSP